MAQDALCHETWLMRMGRGARRGCDDWSLERRDNRIGLGCKCGFPLTDVINFDNNSLQRSPPAMIWPPCKLLQEPLRPRGCPLGPRAGAELPPLLWEDWLGGGVGGTAAGSVTRPNMRMMLGWFSLASTSASRWKDSLYFANRSLCTAQGEKGTGER